MAMAEKDRHTVSSKWAAGTVGSPVDVSRKTKVQLSCEPFKSAPNCQTLKPRVRSGDASALTLISGCGEGDRTGRWNASYRGWPRWPVRGRPSDRLVMLAKPPGLRLFIDLRAPEVTENTAIRLLGGRWRVIAVN